MNKRTKKKERKRDLKKKKWMNEPNEGEKKGKKRRKYRMGIERKKVRKSRKEWMTELAKRNTEVGIKVNSEN